MLKHPSIQATLAALVTLGVATSLTWPLAIVWVAWAVLAVLAVRQAIRGRAV